ITPFGSVSGSGFYDPVNQFFFYDLFDASRNQQIITGGTPTPKGGLLPGGGSVTFESWDLHTFDGTTIPFLPQSFLGFSVSTLFPNATISPFMAAFQSGGTIGVAGPQGVRSHFLWGALDIEGQASSQVSLLMGTAGGFASADGAHLNINQSIRGSIRPDPF